MVSDDNKMMTRMISCTNTSLCRNDDEREKHYDNDSVVAADYLSPVVRWNRAHSPPTYRALVVVVVFVLVLVVAGAVLCLFVSLLFCCCCFFSLFIFIFWSGCVNESVSFLCI